VKLLPAVARVSFVLALLVIGIFFLTQSRFAQLFCYCSGLSVLAAALLWFEGAPFNKIIRVLLSGAISLYLGIEWGKMHYFDWLLCGVVLVLLAFSSVYIEPNKLSVLKARWNKIFGR
jgi:hypothetical protein